MVCVFPASTAPPATRAHISEDGWMAGWLRIWYLQEVFDVRIVISFLLN